MEKLKFFQVIFLFCLINDIFSLPVAGKSGLPEGFCSKDNLLKFENGVDYEYSYETKSTLWINDVSDEAKSTIELKTKAVIRLIDDCHFSLSLKDTSLTGETVNNQDAAKELEKYLTGFYLNSKGELHTNVDFSAEDKAWSRNIKRGIISAFQLKTEDNLRALDFLDKKDKKSAVVYETDILGKCRTIYTLLDDGYQAGKSITLLKKKSLARCTLNNNQITSAIPSVRYLSTAEFLPGKLFIENYECNINVKDNLLKKVVCKETSTYKVGSRGTLGTQAIVEQSLTFVTSTKNSNALDLSSLKPNKLVIEFDQKKPAELENPNFKVSDYIDNICNNIQNLGLTNEHSANYKDLVTTIKKQTKSADILKIYQDSLAKCNLAGITVSQAILFADTESSFDAAINLLDNDAFKDQILIKEYPILTALARSKNPSVALINKFKTYLSSKPASFVYSKKLYLVYSALVRTHCKSHNCKDHIDDWTSFIINNLGTDCSDSSSSDLVTVSLKALGNIGKSKNTDVLEKCALNKNNRAEIRVVAIQTLRKFDCNQLDKLNSNINLLKDSTEDSEIRINAFLILMKCSESPKFVQFVNNELTDLLVKENDLQVLTYIVDYAKEHGITALLNPILANKKINEKFSVNFKELSFNNYKYLYSVLRDGALETETSVIYTSKSFIPRSIRYNVTLSLFGMSINFLDLQVRLEGLDDILKGLVIDKLSSEQLLKKVMENPNKLIDIIQLVAAKLKYSPEKTFISYSLRLYGSDVFYTELNDFSKLLANIKNLKEFLFYTDKTRLTNILLVDSNVKHVLSNGMEFHTNMDAGISTFINKKGTRNVNNDKIDFNINNFYSLSVSLNKNFVVKLNDDNKLSLKKKVNVFTRLRLNIDGTKQNGSAVYNLNLVPTENLQLLSIDGSFHKLGKNSKYTEVKNFKIPQHEVNNCTSSKFHTAVGVDICFTVRRPKIGSLRSLIKTLYKEETQNFLSEDDNDDDDDDDHDHDHDGKEDHDASDHIIRPKLTLSGPYHYELNLKNVDLIKVLTISAKLNKDDEKFNLDANLESKSDKEKVKRLQLTYARRRSDTNLDYQRGFELQLKVPSTNDVRLKLLGDIVYRKKELLNVQFVLDNKILKECLASFILSRKVNEGRLLPDYKLEGIYDSKIRNPKRYRLNLDLNSEGRNIVSNFVLEAQDQKTNNQKVAIAEGLLKLTAKEDSMNEIDYNVDYNLKTYKKSALNVYGQVSGGIFSSNVDLSVKFERQNFAFDKPFNIKAGHLFETSPGKKSNVDLHLTVPFTKIDHNLKALFEFNDETKTLELQLSTPQSKDAPYSILVGRNKKEESSEITIELKNFNINLANRTSKIASTLTKIDDNPVVKSLKLQINRVKISDKIETDISAKKNDKLFLNYNSKLQGSLQDLRSNENVLKEQTFGADVSVKLLDYTGGVKTSLTVKRASDTDQKYVFDLQTEHLIKILLKVTKISSKFILNGDKLDALYEINKEGDVKSTKITSTSSLRKIGDNKEFDVDYEKVLANGEIKKAKGVVKYTAKNFKNFQSSLDIKDYFNFKISAENNRETGADLGTHKFELRYAHLDYQPSERQLIIEIQNVTSSNGKGISLKFNAKKGAPNTLENKAQLDYLVDLNTKLDAKSFNELEYQTNFEFKSKKYITDVTYNSKVKNSNTILSLDAALNAKFPALITESGKLTTLNEKLNYYRDSAIGERKLTYTYETTNKLLGRYIRLLNLSYNKKLVDGVINGDLNADYKLASDEQNLKKLNVKFETDCIIEKGFDGCTKSKVNWNQQIRPQISSVFKQGAIIDVSECEWENKINSFETERANKLSIDAQTKLNCKQKKIIDGKINFKRNLENEKAPIRNLKLELNSDVYDKKLIEINHEKFTEKNGLIEINLLYSPEKSYSKKLAFTRELDPKTNKLVKGNYQWKTGFGSSASKNCEMKIESKTDYYNSLSCRLKSPSLPVEVNYGYNIKVENQKELFSGRRGLQLDLILVGRTMRINYNSNYATEIDGTDDDKDDNDDYEFNSTTVFYWDLLRDPKKYLTVKLKRDNVAVGKTKLSMDILNHPNFKIIKLELNKNRSTNETNFHTSASYELTNGNKNRLDFDVKLNSDYDTNTYTFETNLQKPAFNILYKNTHNKNNGRLERLIVRLSKILRLSIEKSDPLNRRISLNLNNPDTSKYSFDGSSKYSNNIYLVEGSLKKGSAVLSKLTSSFDSNNNVFDVEINGVGTTKNKYQLNLGIYNETIANAHVIDKNTNKVLGLASLNLVQGDTPADTSYLVLNLKWNRLWNQIHETIIGEELTNKKADENKDFNSYLGDVYGEIVKDLKPAHDYGKKERSEIANDFKRVLLAQADFYGTLYPPLRSLSLSRNSTENLENLPLYKRAFRRYNKIANSLTELSLKIRKYSKRFSKYVPRLPLLSYNEDKSEVFANVLTVKRPTLESRTLYQFNAEARDYIRKLGKLVLRIKGNLVRNFHGLGIKALINKYKLRSLKDYTLVGHVYNKRNIIGFDGEGKILQTRCKYLLAHDLSKNKFSVVLNNLNDFSYIISLYANENKIDIGYDKALINNKPTALPQTINFKDDSGSEGTIIVYRTINSVCAKYNKDVKICCHEDSTSCTIALTRWYTGRVTGLLGKADNNPEEINESEWFLEKTCKPLLGAKKVTDEAVKTCYSIFGKHRRSPFRNSFQIVKSEGWNKICGSILSHDTKAKCSLMKAFVHHAQLESIDVDEFSECNQCTINNKKYNVGQTVTSEDAALIGTDYVFVVLPCDKSKFSLNFNDALKNFQTKENNYYVVKIDKDYASIYQAEDGKTSNFDLAQAYKTLSESKTANHIHKSTFVEGMILAGSLFSKRTAQNRHLIIKSCGNCLSYNGLLAIKAVKELTARNIIVSAWGDYDIKMLDGSEDEIPVGYNTDRIFLKNKETQKVETDNADSFKFEHKGDLCSRIAVKTKGSVFNINQLKTPDALEQAIHVTPVTDDESFFQTKYVAKSCEAIKTPFGNLIDFSFRKDN